MKKKITVLIIAVTVFAVATVVMAANDSTVTLTPIAPPGDVFEPRFDKLATHMGYDTDEKFENFHKTALFMGRYCTDEEAFSFVEEMILSGCDAQTTMDIYQFYLTTNEPITIVKQIYDMVYQGESIKNRDIVFENAFNKITNNKCGVLTKDDVCSYLEKGLTASDISQANLLCRKGVMTIQEILDSVLEGNSWEEVIEEITGEKISDNVVADDETLIDAMYVASLQHKEINEVLNDGVNNYFHDKTKKVNNHLKEKGYWKGRKSDNFEKIVKDANAKGIPKEKIEELVDKGFSEVDLINTITSAEFTLDYVESIVEGPVTK